MRCALTLLIACSLFLAGCAQRTERYGAIGSLPSGASSATARLAKDGTKIDLIVDLKGKSLVGDKLVALCELAHFDGTGRASRGGAATISTGGRAKLRLNDSTFDKALWVQGGSCTLLVSGSSDVPTSVIFAGN